jgi:hypothetical protein
MRATSRYFVIASVLVLAVGVGTGLVAYYAGFPGLLAGQAGPDELRLIPNQAGLIAHVEVQQVMASELRKALKGGLPFEATGQQEIEARTGINIEKDIDRVTVSVVPLTDGRPMVGVLALASGRFDENRITTFMTDHGARSETYKGAKVIVVAPENRGDAFSVAFLNPGLVALGNRRLLSSVIDLAVDGGSTVTSNAELMTLVRSLAGRDAWAAGRFDALASHAPLPGELTRQLPSIKWFGAGANVQTGINASLQVEAADEAAAKNFRELVQGFVAFARVQASTRPEFKPFLDSLVLGGSERTVSLSFSAPAEMFTQLTPRH